MSMSKCIDTSVVSAHLQRRMYDAVNGSDLRKVREWLEVRKEEGRLHVCPDKASWLMQGLQRERHAQKKSKPKQRHKTPNSIK